MKFEWDQKKALGNLQKHSLSFEDAASIVLDELKVEYLSPQKGNDQERYMAIGMLRGRYYTVVYTLRGEVIRIISARRARNGEKKRYSAVFGE